MTKVYLEQDGKQYTVSCKGHATGSVEACAAVSCLVYTLAEWLAHSSVDVLKSEMEDGRVMIQYSGGDAAETAFDLICVGFLLLQAEYSEFISLDIRLI